MDQPFSTQMTRKLTAFALHMSNIAETDDGMYICVVTLGSLDVIRSRYARDSDLVPDLGVDWKKLRLFHLKNIFSRTSMFDLDLSPNGS